MVRLSGAQRAVRRLMTDACEIRRDQDHLASATLNLETGKLEAEDAAPLVYRGACILTPSSYRARREDVGGMESSQRAYNVSIPHTAKDIHVGDELVVTKSADRTLVGRKFVVRDVSRTTMLVARDFTVEILETSRD